MKDLSVFQEYSFIQCFTNLTALTSLPEVNISRYKPGTNDSMPIDVLSLVTLNCLIRLPDLLYIRILLFIPGFFNRLMDSRLSA